MSVYAVAQSDPFAIMSKKPRAWIHLLAHRGAEDDIHCMPADPKATDRPSSPPMNAERPHRSAAPIAMPLPRTLRQIHLIPRELFIDIAASLAHTVPRASIENDPPNHAVIASPIAAGVLGENITTAGINLVDLPVGTRLHFQNTHPAIAEHGPVVRITGVRVVAGRLESLLGTRAEDFVVRNAEQGAVVRKAVGVFAVVERGGHVVRGQIIRVVMEEESAYVGPLT